MILDSERVIAGKSIAPMIVSNVIQEIPQETVVLDIGPGTGRLKNSLIDRPDLHFIGLEYDSPLCPNLLKNGYAIINGDVGYIPLPSESVGTAVAINTLHEVCAAPSYEERRQKFQNEILELNRVIKIGGDLIIFDGVDPGHSKIPAVIKPRNTDATKRLRNFINTYKVEKIELSERGNQFVGTMKDIILFQTKAGYVDTPKWRGEQEQLYPFLKESDMIEGLMTGGFEILNLTYPKGRVGVDKLLEQYDIKEIVDGKETLLQESTFPQTQIFIRSRKGNY